MPMRSPSGCGHAALRPRSLPPRRSSASRSATPSAGAFPFVWFTNDEGHQVKDIRTGDQVTADPDAWLPPEADARPRVVSSAPEPK